MYIEADSLESFVFFLNAQPKTDIVDVSGLFVSSKILLENLFFDSHSLL